MIRQLARELGGRLGLALVIGAVVVSVAAASAAALNVNGGTLQVFTIQGGPGVAALAAPPGPEASGNPEASALPDESALPSILPRATPTDGSRPTTGPTGDPAANRADLIVPCPDGADCVIYVTRAGDNLLSIVRFFDVAMSETLALNPWLDEAPHLPVGVDLKLPWPDWLPGRPGQITPAPSSGAPSPDPTQAEPTPDPAPGDASPQPDPTVSPEPKVEPGPTASASPTESPGSTAEPSPEPSDSPSPPTP